MYCSWQHHASPVLHTLDATEVTRIRADAPSQRLAAVYLLLL